MGGVLQGCARTTPRIRAELQASQASTRALARRYGLNPKTVAKWRQRTTTDDAPMGRGRAARSWPKRRRRSSSSSGSARCWGWTTCLAACANPFPG